MLTYLFFSSVFPHSTVPSTGEICLITPDLKKGRKADHEPTVERWEETLRKAGVTEVSFFTELTNLSSRDSGYKSDEGTISSAIQKFAT